MNERIKQLTERFRVTGLELTKAERMRAKGETLIRLERVCDARTAMEYARKQLREAIMGQMPEMAD